RNVDATPLPPRPAVRPADFYARDTLVWGWVYLGSALGIAGTVALPFAAAAWAALGGGVLLLGLGLWLSSHPLVRLTGSHLELKAGPLAPRRLIRYRDLLRLEASGKKAVLFVRGGAGPGTLPLPLNRLGAADARALVRSLRAAVAAY